LFARFQSGGPLFKGKEKKRGKRKKRGGLYSQKEVPSKFGIARESIFCEWKFIGAGALRKKRRGKGGGGKSKGETRLLQGTSYHFLS